eukprot:14347-Heterococcus_DN1.PRE.4
MAHQKMHSIAACKKAASQAGFSGNTTDKRKDWHLCSKYQLLLKQSSSQASAVCRKICAENRLLRQCVRLLSRIERHPITPSSPEAQQLTLVVSVRCRAARKAVTG